MNGAVSLKSIILASFAERLYTNITPPPPIPDECMFMTPRQNMAAIAASTAEPSLARILFPISEHSSVSVATVCFSYLPLAAVVSLRNAKYQIRNTINPMAPSPPPPPTARRLTVLKQKDKEF